MKLIDSAPLADVASELSGDFGNARLSCRVELYSNKMAGSDKKLYKQMSNEYSDKHLVGVEALSPAASSPSMSLGTSPASGGVLCHACSRKTLYYLKATLNAAFAPDYDFSNASSHEFSREPSVDWARRSINASLLGAIGDRFNSLESALWAAIEKEIGTDDIEVFSYSPDLESDPFASHGSLWSFNYFFYTKKLKRTIFFTCHATSCTSLSGDEAEGDTSYFDDSALFFDAAEGGAGQGQMDME